MKHTGSEVIATCIFLFRLLILPMCSRRCEINMFHQIFAHMSRYATVLQTICTCSHLHWHSWAAENFVKFPTTY